MPLAGQLVRGTSNPILLQGAAASWEETGVIGPGSVLWMGPGDYRLWYEGFDSVTPDPNVQVGYATSTDGTKWTKYGSNPVMSYGVAWEQKEVSPAAVIWDADASLFKMWYHGGNNTGPRAIGYATSSDGITWTKYGSNPVLQKGTSGAWDDKWVADCKVIRVSATDYRMWYGGVKVSDGKRQIGYATSADGIAWTKYGSNPILTRGGSGAWDEMDIYAFCPYMISTGEFLAWYAAQGPISAPVDGIGHAYSSDGITWTKGAYNPVTPDLTGDSPQESIHVYRDDSHYYRVVYGQYDVGAPIRRMKGEAKILLPTSEPPPGLVVDDFNRADDSTPPPGANWSNGVITFVGGEGLDILTNTLTRHATGGFRQGGTFSAQNFGPDLALIVDLSAWTGAANDGFTIYLRLANVGSGTTNGYGFDFDGANAALWRLDNAAATVLAGGGSGAAANDQWAVMMIGSQLSGWRKPTGGTWTRIIIADDGTYTAAGRVGVDVYNGQNTKFDNLYIALLASNYPNWRSRRPLPMMRGPDIDNIQRMYSNV